MIKLMMLGAALTMGQPPRDNTILPPVDTPRPAATVPVPVKAPVPVQSNGRLGIPTNVETAPAPGQSGAQYVVIQEKDEKKKNGNGNGNGNGDKKEDEEEKKDEGPWRLLPDPIAGFKVTGFIYGTGNFNPRNNGTRYNGPLTMSDQEGAFLNQFYVSIDRAMEDCFTVGGGVSVLYGNDYNASQSFGWELQPGRLIGPGTQKWNTGQDYGVAIPQLFAEFGTKKASLVVGHFWTPIGHCVVPGNGNFFNSQPYSYMHGQPFDHWGGMAKFAPNENWSGYFGVVNGWGALDRQLDSASIIFGGKYTAKESKWYNNFQMYIGQEPENLGADYGNRTLINNVTYYKLNECVELIHEFTLGVQQNEGIGASTYYGFSPYILRKINDNLKAGIRADIFRDPGGIVAGIRSGNPNVGPYNGTFYSINAGLNWTPNGSKNLMVRPEIRYDWFGGNGRPFDDGQGKDMFMIMLGAYYQF